MRSVCADADKIEAEKVSEKREKNEKMNGIENRWNTVERGWKSENMANVFKGKVEERAEGERAKENGGRGKHRERKVCENRE